MGIAEKPRKMGTMGFDQSGNQYQINQSFMS